MRIRPGSIIDRSIALDGVVSAIICGVAIAAVTTQSGILVDIALVGGLLGFLTLSTVARYVAGAACEHRRRRGRPRR